MIGTSLFAAGTATAAQLTLNWIDNAGGTTIFNIERKIGTTGTYEQIATTAIGIATYTDSAVVAGTTYCYRVKASNFFGDSGYSNEACGSPSAGFDVSVVTTGSGSVVSSPAGITCPGTCVQSFAPGKVVTLTAAPDSGSSFSGWSGGCAGTDPCILAGNTSVTVTATFGSGGSVALVVTGNPAIEPYAVEAQTTLTGALTVNFFVDGSFAHQENVGKYCLFGADGPCNTGTLGAGVHVIKAQVLRQSDSTVQAETQITVTEGPVALVVTGNPATGPYAVEAQTTLTGALTVNFFVDGGFVHQENVGKYCLFGGDGPCNAGALGAGAHVIKAQVLRQGDTTVLAETQITVTE